MKRQATKNDINPWEEIAAGIAALLATGALITLVAVLGAV